MIDIYVTNAFLLYKKLGGTRRQIWFRKNVIRSLLGSEDRPKTATAPVAFKQNKASDLTRLIGQHYLCVIPANASKAGPCKRCVVCRKNGRRVAECFKRFHTEHEL